jgi:hypothetical protein
MLLFSPIRYSNQIRGKTIKSISQQQIQAFKFKITKSQQHSQSSPLIKRSFSSMQWLFGGIGGGNGGGVDGSGASAGSIGPFLDSSLAAPTQHPKNS